MNDILERLRDGKRRGPERKTIPQLRDEREKKVKDFIAAQTALQNLHNVTDSAAGNEAVLAAVGAIAKLNENRAHFSDDWFNGELTKLTDKLPPAIEAAVADVVTKFIEPAEAVAAQFRNRRTRIIPGNAGAQGQLDSLLGMAKSVSIEGVKELARDAINRDDGPAATHLTWMLGLRKSEDESPDGVAELEALREETELRFLDQGPEIIREVDRLTQFARNQAADVIETIIEEGRWEGSSRERALFILPGGEEVSAHNHLPIAEPIPGMDSLNLPTVE